MKVLYLSLPGLLLERFRNNNPSIPRTNNSTLEKLLIELRISDADSDSSDTDGDPLYRFDLAGDVPSPTQVSFNYINYQEINIRWDNVTSLEVPLLFDYHALKILQLAPKLQAFKFLDDNDGDPTKLPQVTHCSLRMLCLNWDRTHLDFLTCPVLNKLSYHYNPTSETSLGAPHAS